MVILLCSLPIDSPTAYRHIKESILQSGAKHAVRLREIVIAPQARHVG